MKALFRLLAMLLLPVYAWSADSGSGAVAEVDGQVLSKMAEVVDTTAPLIIESDPADDANGQVWDVHLTDGTPLEASDMLGTRKRVFRVPESAVRMLEVDGCELDVVIHGRTEQTSSDDSLVKNFEISQSSIAFTQRLQIKGNEARSYTLDLSSGNEPLLRETYLDEEHEEVAIVLKMRSFDQTKDMLKCQTSPWYKNYFTGACRQNSGSGSLSRSSSSSSVSSGSGSDSSTSSSGSEVGEELAGVTMSLLATAWLMGAGDMFESAPVDTYSTPQLEYVYSYIR